MNDGRPVDDRAANFLYKSNGWLPRPSDLQ